MGISHNRGGGGPSFEKTSETYLQDAAKMNAAALKECNAAQREDFLAHLDFMDLEELVKQGAVTRKESILVRHRNKRPRW